MANILKWVAPSIRGGGIYGAVDQGLDAIAEFKKQNKIKKETGKADYSDAIDHLKWAATWASAASGARSSKVPKTRPTAKPGKELSDLGKARATAFDAKKGVKAAEAKLANAKTNLSATPGDANLQRLVTEAEKELGTAKTAATTAEEAMAKEVAKTSARQAAFRGVLANGAVPVGTKAWNLFQSDPEEKQEEKKKSGDDANAPAVNPDTVGTPSGDGGVNPASGQAPVAPRGNAPGGNGGNRGGNAPGGNGGAPVPPRASAGVSTVNRGATPDKGTVGGEVVDLTNTESRNRLRAVQRDNYSRYREADAKAREAQRHQDKIQGLVTRANAVDKFHSDLSAARVKNRTFSNASDWEALGNEANGARDYEQFDKDSDDYKKGKAAYDRQRADRIVALSDRAKALNKRFRNGENSAEGLRFQKLMNHVGNPFEYTTTVQENGKDVTKTITAQQFRKLSPEEKKNYTRQVSANFNINDAQLEALEKTIGGMEKSTDKWKSDFDEKMMPYKQRYADDLRQKLGPAGQYIGKDTVTSKGLDSTIGTLEGLVDKQYEEKSKPLLTTIGDPNTSQEARAKAYKQLQEMGAVGNARKGFDPAAVLRGHLGSGDPELVGEYNKAQGEYLQKFGYDKDNPVHQALGREAVENEARTNFDQMYAARLATAEPGKGPGVSGALGTDGQEKVEDVAERMAGLEQHQQLADDVMNTPQAMRSRGGRDAALSKFNEQQEQQQQRQLANDVMNSPQAVRSRDGIGQEQGNFMQQQNDSAYARPEAGPNAGVADQSGKAAPRTAQQGIDLLRSFYEARRTSLSQAAKGGNASRKFRGTRWVHSKRRS